MSREPSLYVWLDLGLVGCHKVNLSWSYNLFPHILCLHVSICYIMSFGLIFPAAKYFFHAANENDCKLHHLCFPFIL